MDAAFVALRDGRLLLAANVGGEGDSPVAMFRKEDITYLGLPSQSSIPGVGGLWEIGFRDKTGEHRVIFHGPGLVLVRRGRSIG